MTATTTDLSKGREARRAAIRARMADAPTFGPEQTIPLADLRAGDYLVVIRHPRLQGLRYGSAVTGLRHVNRGEVVHEVGSLRVYAPATGLVAETARTGEADLGSAVWPLDATAVVRRVES